VFLAADSPGVSDPEIDPQMRPYLEWLEKEKRAVPPSGHSIPVVAGPKPPSAPTIPAVGTAEVARAVPVIPPPAVKKAKAPRPDKDERRARREKAVPPPSPQTFDVELVPMPPPERALLPGGVTRRDLACFFIGAGSAAVAYLLGWGVATLMRRTPPEGEGE
jgi:hypothetical protein